MRLVLDTTRINDYGLFLKVKSLPKFRFEGRTAIVPDEYAARLGLNATVADASAYSPIDGLWDYQSGIAAMAIRKERFAVFADCGLGKTLILLEFARHAAKNCGGKIVLIVSPLMVIEQTMEVAANWYGDAMSIERVAAAGLAERLANPAGGVVITNYDALTDELTNDNIGAVILDESSLLKSHYGAWGQTCIRLGRGVRWKLACTGTPAPNDRIEYANHAVFLDVFPTVNSFLARYFVNRGQTDNRWEIKPHALRPFYRDLSHWCIFLTNPATYGWKDNTRPLPPINVHIHDVDLTTEQTELAYQQTGTLFADQIGGITSRSVLSQIAKGSHRGQRTDTHKPAYIRKLIESWPDESTIVWCHYNAEQDIIRDALPGAASIDGSTPHAERMRIIAEFKAGRVRTLISKPRILGFGLNLQIATRMVFSGLQDSYEEYYQAVKRANRYGATHPLSVHIPVTDIERPMIETVLRKAKRVHEDTEIQERLFKELADVA